MLTPKNWTSFQHYKDRSPAWIKLHRGLLDDFAFSRLPVASRALAPLLWLLASEYEDGKITAGLEEIAFRLRMSDAELVEAINPLISAGFFVSDSSVLAARKQDAIPEKEREIEEEKRKNIRAVASATRTGADEKFEEFWRAYPKRDGANPKAPARKAFFAFVESGVDPGEIVAGARSCAEKETEKIGTPYIPQAIKWLRDRRWEDYAATGPPENVELLEYHRQQCMLRKADGNGAETEIGRDTGMGEEGADLAAKLRSPH